MILNRKWELRQFARLSAKATSKPSATRGHEIALYAEDRPAAVLPVSPRFVVNDIHAACDEIRAGNGVGIVPIGKAKKHRELVRIFPAFNGRIRQAWLVYRKTSYMPAIVTETVKRIEAASLSWFARNNDWTQETSNTRSDWPEAGLKG